MKNRNSILRSARLLGIGVLIIARTVSAQDEFLCASLWPSGELDMGFGDMPCEEYRVRDEQFLALDGQHRVFFPPGWLTDEDKHRLVRLSIDAVTESLTLYNDLARRNGFRPVTETNVIFGVEEYVRNWDEAAGVAPVRDIVFTDACPILVDAAYALDSPSDEHQQVIAHELFHCLEHSNGYFPEEYDAWWAEGAADYLSNLVYNCANIEYSNSILYDPSITPPDHLENRKPYSTVVLFQQLGNTRGPDWVLRQLFSLPREANPDDYLDALATWPDIEDLFHDFAKHFVEDQIYDTGMRLEDCARNRLLPVEPPFVRDPLLIIADDGSEIVHYDTQSFEFEVQPIDFVAGKTFDIEISTNETRGTFSIKGPGTEWGAFPARIETDCGGPAKQYLLLATSTAPASTSFRRPYTVTIQVLARDRDDCPMSLLEAVPLNCHAQTGGIPLDECLAGSWRMTDDSLTKSHWGRMPPPPTKEISHSYTGTIRLAFDGSGTFLKQFDVTFTLVKSTTLGKIITETQTDYRGHVGGCVLSLRHAPGRGFLSVGENLIDKVTKHTHGIRDLVFNVNRIDEGTPWNHWPRLQGAGRMRYSCKADTLMIGSRVYQRIR